MGNSGTNFEQNTSEKLVSFFVFQNCSTFHTSSYLVSLHEIVKQCSTCNFSNFVERLKGDIIKKFTCNFSNFVERYKGTL